METCGADATNFIRTCAEGGLVELRHRRLGHSNVMSVYGLENMLRDINLGKTSHPNFTLICKSCTQGKQYAA